jgi:hypothetical protein
MWNGSPAWMHCFQSDSVDPLDGTSHACTFQPTIGGDPNMWGVAWTPAMVNDPTFGCAFDGWHASGDTINIDCVQITITYTPDGTPAVGVCDGIPCDLRLDFSDVIKSLVTKYVAEGEGQGFECVGLKIAPHLMKCSDLDDILVCGSNYTLEEALKASLVHDGCDGWALRVWVLPPDLRLR